VTIKTAVVLPPRELACARQGGAITTTVKEFYGASPDDEIRILGRLGDTKIESLPIAEIRPSWTDFVFGQTRAYTMGVARWLRKHPSCRVVEVHNRTAIALRLKDLFPGRKICLYIHNAPSTMRGLKTAEQRLAALQRLDHFICVSKFVQRELLKGFEDQRQKTTVVYNGQPAFEAQKKSNTIIYCGRIVPSKGALELAKSISRVLPNHPDWSCTFIGAAKFGATSPTTDYERRVINALDALGEQTQYLGALSHHDAMKHVSTSAIMVVPSLEPEALNRSLAEAMAAGLACIYAPRDAMQELVGNAGLLADPKHPEQLDIALETLITDKALREQIQTAAQTRIQRNFSLNSQSKILNALRQDLLEDR